ncbi:ABC transporter permease [Amycolatopsis azurea]|uniref:Binding-protein-dependent transporter n=1 Tax=Amycolatopsis azurea DSM 43854 TaxID=1238180 RepID=M2P138_9PSEU|nr:ABC transporter permease [Amycolatopsis azurea]EMD28784.1 Binding-protein-dependent transporter [Amycolatopsis azurea DSM 43854]OOC04061.1 peptide ABC transporter permease [Amycolatopsis azurea DSM 43854]
MKRYLFRRLLQAVFVLWAAFTVSFVILYLLPGDAVSAKLGGGEAGLSVTPEQLAAAKAEYGLDDPLPLQYGKRLVAALQGDFGRSISTGDDATDMVVSALPPTLAVTGFALVLAILFGGGVAFAGTYTRHRWLGNVLLALPPLGISLPPFWVGLILIQFFSFQLRLVPALGSNGFASLILPAITLAIPTGAIIGQVLAKSLRTQLAEPYAEIVLAKGASRLRVHFGHLLRNAAVPTLTIAGVVAGNLIAGSVITETVFSRDGLGRVTSSAVTAQDIPVVQAVIVLAALVFVVINLLVDLVYPLLDPRIRHRETADA